MNFQDMHQLNAKILVGILLRGSVRTSFPPCVKERLPLLKDVTKKVEIKLIPINRKNVLSEIDGVEVLFADPALLCDVLFNLPKSVKWIQCSWAGLDGMFKTIDIEALPTFNPHFVLTRLGGCFTQVMADYVIGAIVALERDFKSQYSAQSSKKWLTAENAPTVFSYRSLSTLTIGVLGAGNIGLEVASRLHAAGMKVLGLKRTPVSKDELYKYPQVDEFHTADQLNQFLSSCHYICNVLPSTPQTVDLLSGDVLSVCRERCPGFINVGRGDVISEDSLLRALENKWISGAFLDVFEDEPLPPSSRLWSMDHVTITPHSSGKLNNIEKAADVFIENLKLYANGKTLRHVYDWSQGY